MAISGSAGLKKLRSIPAVVSAVTAWALERGTVVEVPVTGFDLRRKLYMMRYKLRTPQRAVEAFWGFIHDPINADLLHLAES